MHKLKLLACGLLAVGCTKTESDDVLTSGIYASIEAQAKGDGKTDVSAQLFVGNPIGLNYVELTGDDSLVAISNTESKTMIERQVLNTVDHHAELTGDGENAEFEVVFHRTIDAGAPSSIASLPAKFSITTAPQTASRAQPLQLNWSPAGLPNQMSWSAHGDCVEDESALLSLDEGAVVIPAGAIKKRMGDAIADTCAVTFTIKRSKAGILDSHYGKGGTVLGSQVRTVSIMMTP